MIEWRGKRVGTHISVAPGAAPMSGWAGAWVSNKRPSRIETGSAGEARNPPQPGSALESCTPSALPAPRHRSLVACT